MDYTWLYSNSLTFGWIVTENTYNKFTDKFTIEFNLYFYWFLTTAYHTGHCKWHVDHTGDCSLNWNRTNNTSIIVFISTALLFSFNMFNVWLKLNWEKVTVLGTMYREHEFLILMDNSLILIIFEVLSSQFLVGVDLRSIILITNRNWRSILLLYTKTKEIKHLDLLLLCCQLRS